MKIKECAEKLATLLKVFVDDYGHRKSHVFDDGRVWVAALTRTSESDAAATITTYYSNTFQLATTSVEIGGQSARVNWAGGGACSDASARDIAITMRVIWRHIENLLDDAD